MWKIRLFDVTKVYSKVRNQLKSIRKDKEFGIEYETNMNDAAPEINANIDNVSNVSSDSVIGPMSENNKSEKHGELAGVDDEWEYYLDTVDDNLCYVYFQIPNHQYCYCLQQKRIIVDIKVE